MNPDPNQPQQPQVPPVPLDPAQTPQPTVPVQPNVAPTDPGAGAPVQYAAAPEIAPQPVVNPTEAPAAPAAPTVQADQPANPFFGAQAAPVDSATPQVGGVPSVTPEAPVVAGAPIASGPSNAAPKKPLNKKVLLFGGIGAAVVLIIAAVLVYFLFFFVSPQDYKKAADAAPAVHTLEVTSRDDLSNVMNAKSNTVDEAKANVAKASASLQALQEGVKKFDGQRALHDGDLKKPYAAYKKDYDAYVTFAGNYLDSAKTGQVAVVACTEASDDLTKSGSKDFASYKAYVDKCRSGLNGATNVKDEDIKTVITAYIKFLDDSTPIYEKLYNSSSSSDYNALLATLKQLSPISKTFSDTVTAAGDNIKKRYEAVGGTSDSFPVFTKALQAKVK